MLVEWEKYGSTIIIEKNDGEFNTIGLYIN